MKKNMPPFRYEWTIKIDQWGKLTLYKSGKQVRKFHALSLSHREEERGYSRPDFTITFIHKRQPKLSEFQTCFTEGFGLCTRYVVEKNALLMDREKGVSMPERKKA